jgi:hypothetical protein
MDERKAAELAPLSEELFEEYARMTLDGDELDHGEAMRRLVGTRGLVGTSAKKSGRPLSEITLAIRDEIADLTERFRRMTVRQVFYQLEMAGVVDKTENGYRQVQRQALVMRREELLSWDFITDGTRWQRKPDSYEDIGSYVDQMARTYRRDLWQGHDVRLEVWLEKDALADLVVDMTDRWDVPLMVSRGQSSATFLHAAAREAERAFRAADVATYIYALYDYDAGGDRAAAAVERELPAYAPDTPIYFERLAVTAEQIEEWDLPTRPPKAKDPDAKKWGDKPCVELDAIDPDTLTRLVEEAITHHVDLRAWEVERAVESEEREGLLAMARAWENDEDDEP